MNNTLLKTTEILDFTHPSIQALIKQRRWHTLNEYERIGAVYTFVKDEINFGYNASDDLKASEVLLDGYGQCNTKSTLLMALLRALGIRCRFHGFTIDKALQKGALPLWAYTMAPQSIIHSWIEVDFQGQWLELEGFIIDDQYLAAIQQKFATITQSFCGYGIATDCLAAPEIQWQGRSTYIQKQGINHDFGIYDQPDDFYREYGTNLKGIKRWLYQNLLRHLINRHVNALRNTNSHM